MTQTTVIRHSKPYPLQSKTIAMDSAADKEERKREYNRLAQREFRRRRKEHLKNLEQAQKDQSTEQSEEIERLRYQNDELRRENEALRSQVYGSSSSSNHGLLSAPIHVSSMSNENRSYSLSPSISGTSISGAGSPPSSMGADMMALSLTSSMMQPSMQAYTDPSALTPQPYSMVHPSGLRHSSQSSPESSGFRNSRSAVGASFQSLNISEPAPNVQGRHRSHSNQGSNSLVIAPYDRNKARAEINQIFQPLYSDTSITSNPERHLTVLRSLSENLPAALKPSKGQLETPHYCGIDMIPSLAIRERLLTVSNDVAQSFINEIGIVSDEREETGQLTIWGDDPLNEMSWEFSQAALERWGWLLGRDWVNRANLWRRQRGASLLPEW